MECGKDVAAGKFVWRICWANGVYVVLTGLVGLLFYRFRPHGVVAYGLAVVPSVGILGVIMAVAAYLREEKDEFQRDLLVQCLLAGLGGLLAVESIWGTLQSFTHVARFQPLWVVPLFWCCFAVAYPVISRRYR